MFLIYVAKCLYFYPTLWLPGTVNPVLLAAATNTVVCSRNEDENAKVGVRL